ncbi:hypothetical protein LXL04_014209 [Taraxacum kok-saghyz]
MHEDEDEQDDDELAYQLVLPNAVFYQLPASFSALTCQTKPEIRLVAMTVEAPNKNNIEIKGGCKGSEDTCEGKRSGRLLKLYKKPYLKSPCYFSFKNSFIHLSESCSSVSTWYHSSRTVYPKVTHLTKPTFKLPVPNPTDMKRTKSKCP